MSSRRQSIRVSSQSSSSVTLTKTSFSSFSSSTSTSSPSSVNRKSKRFSIDSFTGMTSPEWISGSEVVFKTPKLPESTRRSTIHVQKRSINDMDFKIPSLMFSSPPGVKTRSRRSSMHISTQQKKSSPKGKAQKKKQTEVKRAGKATQGKKKTQITSAKVSLTDVSLVSDSSIKTRKSTKGKVMSKVKTSPARSSRVQNSSSSVSGNKSLDLSRKSSPQKSPSRSSAKKRETRRTTVSAASPSKITVVKEMLTTAVSPSQRSLAQSKKRTSKGKNAPSPSKSKNAQILKSSPAKKTRSTRKRSSQQVYDLTPSPKKQALFGDKSSATLSESTPSKRIRSRSTRQKQDSSERTSYESPKTRMAKGYLSQQKSSPSKVKPLAKTPDKSSKSSTQVTEKFDSSRRTPARMAKRNLQSSGTSGKSPKSSKKVVSKKTPNQKDRRHEQSYQQIESPSDIKQNALTPESPKTKSRRSARQTPLTKIKSTPSQQKQQSASKAKQKSPTVSSPQTKKTLSVKRTPNRREKVRATSSQKKMSSSSKSVKTSPVVKSSIASGAGVNLQGTPNKIVTSKPARTVNLAVTLQRLDASDKGRRSLTGNFSLSHPENSQSMSLFSSSSPSKVSSSKEAETHKAVTKKIMSSTSREFSAQGSQSKSVELSRSRWTAKRDMVSELLTPSYTSSHENGTPISSRKSLSSARESRRFFISENISGDFGKSLQKSEQKSADPWESFSQSTLKKRKFESEAEEIDRMVSTMVQASLPRKRKSPSPSRVVATASPARITLMKETETLVSPVSSLTGRKSLRIMRNVTPSTAAPKAKKILGVYDSPSRNVETSQKYSFSRKSETSSLGQFEIHDTRNIDRSLIRTRDDDDDDNDSSENLMQESVSGGTETEQEEEMSMQETGSSVEEDEASATDGTAEDESSMPEEEEMTDNESDEDIEDDRDVTLSHTSHSQRCTIS